ncbi:hypothetical protein HDR58_02505 [bacterium]|nr:hypothetical protein [bacterium]
MRKKTICIDFDGVLNNYNGWQGEDNLFEMKDGCDEFLNKVSKIYNITIFTTRKKSLVVEWLNKYKLSKYIENITDKKIPAEIYIDDRAVNFDGNYDNTYSSIKEFLPYWK